MPNRIEFYLNGASSVAELETVEIKHRDFSKAYRFVRNHMEGIEATIEDGLKVLFEYRPIVFDILGFKDDLDQKLNISLGTLGGVLPTELANLRANDGFLIKPEVIYRSYQSNDLDNMLEGPIDLLAKEIATRESGVGITAEAENISSNRTGESYDLERFYMLRGLL